MTVCGAGTGVPKAGFSIAQYVGPAAIGGALAGLSGWKGAAVGAALGFLSYDLSTFCPAGPAAFPTFTVGDIEALLSPFPLPGYAAAFDKLKDFMDGLFWPIFCECSGGASTIGTPSTYPSGAPQQVPNPAAPAVGACATNTFGPTVYSQNTTNLANYNGTNLAVLGATSVQLTLTTSVFTAPGGSTTFTITQEQPVGTVVRTDVVVEGPTANDVFSLPIAPGVEILRISSHTNTWSGSVSVTRKMEFFCGVVPGATQVPCCPPDATTQAVLDRILGLVTLIQRQAAPFAYVYGAQTTGLTGHGAISTSGLVGVSVDVTTLPSSYGRETGSPETLFDVGYVTLGTADGYEQSRRIDSDGTLFIPPLAGLYTTIGYTLSPGVEVSIRELVREP